MTSDFEFYLYSVLSLSYMTTHLESMVAGVWPVANNTAELWATSLLVTASLSHGIIITPPFPPAHALLSTCARDATHQSDR